MFKGDISANFKCWYHLDNSETYGYKYCIGFYGPRGINLCNFISIFREKIFLVYLVTNKQSFMLNPNLEKQMWKLIDLGMICNFTCSYINFVYIIDSNKYSDLTQFPVDMLA